MRNMTALELVKAIVRCQHNINQLLNSTKDSAPGSIMGLGDFYIEKSMLLDELARRLDA